MIIWVTTLALGAILSLLYLRGNLSVKGSSESARHPHGQKDLVQKRKVMHTSVQALGASPTTDVDNDDGGERTPKARPINANGTPIPAFNLDEPVMNHEKTTPPKVNGNSGDSMKPPQIMKTSAGAGLMPPPSLSTRLAPPPSASSGLRVPITGPLPDRSPDAQKKRGLAANTAGKRNKVQLKPGHSPLDWANLTRSSANLAGVPGLQRVTPTMLKYHHGRKGRHAWASYKGKVYNITPYLPFHPGGEGELMRAAGKDGEKLFMEYHPWVNWDSMLGSCLVGIMVSESAGNELDDID